MCPCLLLPLFTILHACKPQGAVSVPASTSLTSLFSSLSVSCLSFPLLCLPILSSGFLLPLLKILRGLPVSPGAERSFK